MDLLEYQSKELFRQMGIPILPSQRIAHPRELKGLKIPYPVVLKSQVYSSGRAKAGGIRFVENTIDAIAAAQTIFNLSIGEQYPEVVLAEAKYSTERELYLAIVLDRSARRPVLLGSQEGGIEIEPLLNHMQKIVIEEEFSPYYARRLALKMGLQGALIQSVSSIVEKMYRLFVQKDLDLIEINPLAVNSNGDLMALDGKAIVNDEAINRHDDLALLQAKKSNSSAKHLTYQFHLPDLGGNIAILCNGTGLTMATLDLVHQARGKPATFLNIGGEFHAAWTPTTLPARLEQGLELMLNKRGIKVILINIVGSVLSCSQIAETLVTYLQRQSRRGHYIPALVVRLLGENEVGAKEVLNTIEIPLMESLDDAIALAIKHSKN
jgi:succinyl-CoA synthetase beta subunit